MAITTKNRKQLKSYFIKNAIPTEGNFADLVDAPLNQAEDGIFKVAGEPLSVVAAPGEQKRTLRFYTSYPAAQADWQISLSPAGNPADPASVKLGFGIADGAGNTRLFIDPATGNVGVGSVTPADRLTVRDGDLRIAGGANRRAKIISDSQSAGIEIVTRDMSAAGTPFIDFTQGELDSPNFGTRLVSLGNNTLQIQAGTGTATLRVKGDLDVEGQQSKLDVKEQAAATIRAADLRFGHSSRKGLGRALVDTAEALVVNYGKDWPRTDVHSPLTVNGNVGVNCSDPGGPFEVRAAGNAWGRFIVNTTAMWGDGASQYVTIGAGGAAGIMLANAHIPWISGEARASIRYGRSGGVSTGSWWDVGVRADNNFSFAYNGGDHKLWLKADGNVGIGVVPEQRLDVNGNAKIRGDLEVTGSADLGWARHLTNFNVPLRTGFYQGTDPVGDVPDGSHSWTHLIAVRHANPANHHQFQIASTFGENDKMYFRKIAKSGAEAATTAWNEVATVTNGLLKIGEWSIESAGENLVIRRGNATVARFSTGQDRLQLFRYNNGAAPYWYFNAQGNHGVHNG
jgi:hypothetical protein